jgi:hypothetical protein
MVLPLPRAGHLPDVPSLAGTDRTHRRPAGWGAAMTPQIAVCASRLPDREAEQFIARLQRAARLAAEAAELRRSAWAIYHDATGRPPRAKTTRKPRR